LDLCPVFAWVWLVAAGLGVIAFLCHLLIGDLLWTANSQIRRRIRSAGSQVGRRIASRRRWRAGTTVVRVLAGK
jgi:hypothetical protein